MTKYLFLTNNNFKLEEDGMNVKQAMRKALIHLKLSRRKYIKLGIIKPYEKMEIVAYDTFNRDGLSFYNWKRLRVIG
jgi:hypothetical protein